jgi:DNA invertase Pin-like site-specific DNA recombinase
MLGRTSTLELQDPYGSITRQITSVKEWLPEGFYIDGYYWDIESGGLDLDQRGHGDNWQPFVAKGLPRTGGLADLLAESRSPAPRFAAVVCEDIERSARDTFNALKLERQLADSDILLFATDEPLDLEGTEPATILLRRTKQNIAEYFRLQLKQKMWRGMRTHAAEGYNLGKVIDGYLPDKIPHPAPAKAAHGRTKTRLVLDDMRAPIIAAIYDMRAWQKLGVPTIHARLCADPATYPPADPETGWTVGGVYSILGNPKYTGYQVFGRVRKGKRTSPDKWYWSEQPTHPAIIDRHTWETAQMIAEEHRSSRDGGSRNPANWRTYPFRSRVHCKLCKHRMCGTPRRHPERANDRESFYYACHYNPSVPAHVAAAPDHPRTVTVREDFLEGETLRGLAAYLLAPGREQRLRELIPATATAKKEQHDRQTQALEQRAKRIKATQDNLMKELRGSFDMPDHAGEEYRRRIRADYTTLDIELQQISTQLDALASDPAPSTDIDLVSLLPETTRDLSELPPDLQADFYNVFDIQIVWNAPKRQATFTAAITEATAQIVQALLDRADDDPASATSATTSTDTDTAHGQRSSRIPMLRKTLPASQVRSSRLVAEHRPELVHGGPVAGGAGLGRGGPRELGGQLAAAQPVRRVQEHGPAGDDHLVLAASGFRAFLGLGDLGPLVFGQLRPAEDGVQGLRVVLAGERVVLDDLLEFVLRDHDHAAGDVELAGDGLFQLAGQPGGVGLLAGEDRVAALDVGGHIGVPEAGHQVPQLGHGHLVAPADVDAPQQGDMGPHIRILPRPAGSGVPGATDGPSLT